MAIQWDDNAAFGPGIDFQAPGIGEQITGGLMAGLRQDPLLSPAIDAIGELIPGVDRRTLEAYERQLAGLPAADVAEFIGRWAPTIVMSVGAFGAGRMLARQGLRMLAAGTAPGRTGQLARVAARAQDVAGNVGPLAAVPKPLVERGAEIVGGAVGIGGLDVAGALAEGASPEEAAIHGLISTGIVAGAETGLAGLGALVSRRARGFDNRAIADTFTDSQGRRVLGEQLQTIHSDIGRLRERLWGILGTDGQHQQLQMAFARGSAALTPEARAAATETRQAIRARAQEARGILTILEGPQVRGTPLGEIRRIPLATAMTRDIPFDANGVRLSLAELNRRLLRTPESYAGTFGPTFARVLPALQGADDLSIVEAQTYEKLVSQWARQAERALGVSPRAADRGGLLPYSHVYEQQGPEALRDFAMSRGRSRVKAELAVEAFENSHIALDQMNRRIQRLGGRPAIPLDGSLGVVRYIPHHSQPGLTVGQIEQRLRAAGRSEDEIAEWMTTSLMEDVAGRLRDVGRETNRLGRFASFDFNRTIHGTLQTKVRLGLPVDVNPFSNVLRNLQAGARRANYAEVVGPRGELIETFVQAARSEGANADMVRNILEGLVGQKFADYGLQNVARKITSVQTGSKLTLAVFANATQPLNNLFYAGTKMNMRAFQQRLTASKAHSQEVSAALGIHHSMIRGLSRSFGEEGYLRSSADRFGEFMLKATGFDLAERNNRVMSGYVGQALFRDTVAKGVRGRLRGPSLDRARRWFLDLNTDLDQIVNMARRRGNDYLTSPEFQAMERRAIFRFASRTQFIPSRLRRPELWNHPVGRVATQFKTFALGQVRLLRDAVFAEAAHGNLKPMAYFLSLTPVAGEFVGDARAIVQGRDREATGITRMLENTLFVGGIGLATDIVQAGRRGRLFETLLGPTFSDALGFAERMLQGDVDAIGKDVLREPIVQGMMALLGAGVLTMDEIDTYLDSLGSPQ